MQKQPDEFGIIWNVNKHYIKDFKTKLSCEIWGTIFGDNDVIEYLITSIIFFLRIFYSSFPKKKIQIKNKKRQYLDVQRYKDIHKPQK